MMSIGLTSKFQLKETIVKGLLITFRLYFFEVGIYQFPLIFTLLNIMGCTIKQQKESNSPQNGEDAYEVV